MTIREFWHLKYGTIVKFGDGSLPGWHWQGEVIKRSIVNESYGFIIAEKGSEILYTGKKLLEITFALPDGHDVRFIQSNKFKDIKNLVIIKEV